MKCIFDAITYAIYLRIQRFLMPALANNFISTLTHMPAFRFNGAYSIVIARLLIVFGCAIVGLTAGTSVTACPQRVPATDLYVSTDNDTPPPQQSDREEVPDQPVPTRAGLRLEEIDQRVAQFEELLQRQPPPSEEIKTLIDAGLTHLSQGRHSLVTSHGLESESRTAPIDEQAIKRKIESSRFHPELGFDQNTPARLLPAEKALETTLSKKRVQRQKLGHPIAVLSAAEIQQRISDIKSTAESTNQKLIEAQRQIDTTPLNDDQRFIQARRWNLEAERIHWLANLSLLDAETRHLESTANLAELRSVLAHKRNDQLDAEIALIEHAINKLHTEEVQALRDQLHDRGKVSPPFQNIAQSNSVLTRQLSTLVEEVKALDDIKDALHNDVKRIKDEETTSRDRINVVGLNDSFGQMLQRNRAALALTLQRYPPLNERNREIANVQIAIFRQEDELEKISNIPATASATVRSLVDKKTVPADQVQSHIDEAQELLSLRKKILQRLKHQEEKKQEKLVAIKTEQTELVSVCNQYSALIDENILWMRSAPMISLADGSPIAETAAKLFAPAQWATVVQSIASSFRRYFFPSLLLLLIGAALVLFYPRAVGQVEGLGKKAVRRSCRDFSLTLSAYFLTALIAVTRLAPLVLVGWLLTSNLQASQFASSLGYACLWTVSIGLPFEYLRQTCRTNGLAHAHFAWTEQTRKTLWHHLTWFNPIGLPVVGILIWLPLVSGSQLTSLPSTSPKSDEPLLELVSSEISSTTSASANALTATAQNGFYFSNSNASNRSGRAALLLLLVFSQIFAFKILHPKRGVLLDSHSSILSHNTWQHIGYGLFVTAIVIPLVLMLMAIIGYYFSAVEIGKSLLKTIILAIAVAVVYSGAMRLLLVRRRHLRYEQLLHQRNQARLAAEKIGKADAAINPAEVIDVDLQNDTGLDITDVSRQARELTSVIFLIISAVILLGIWQYLLPASKFMDEWELWSISVAGKIEAVTIRDALFSAMMFVVTYFGVRNIPGMLELVLLQRLPLDAGARYAVTSIFRYLLLVVGGIFALGYLKIPWSNYSWLVAAISVGLGFGLQEIVANFVSGLILLLERPVRVGDVVTIDGTTGIVSRIQMRATTVTNWDNQELVVPNKDLISGKLLNWTLSSVVNRIALKFGVAYGTDPEYVQNVILKAIESNRGLLKEPPPMVTFENFGDNSLDFTLRCCVSTIERRWIIVHELNVAINKALAKENIAIPFPQRDVHIISPKQTDV